MTPEFTVLLVAELTPGGEGVSSGGSAKKEMK